MPYIVPYRAFWTGGVGQRLYDLLVGAHHWQVSQEDTTASVNTAMCGKELIGITTKTRRKVVKKHKISKSTKDLPLLSITPK